MQEQLGSHPELAPEGGDQVGGSCTRASSMVNMQLPPTLPVRGLPLRVCTS